MTRECVQCGFEFNSTRCPACNSRRQKTEARKAYQKAYRLTPNGVAAHLKYRTNPDNKKKRAVYAKLPHRKEDARRRAASATGKRSSFKSRMMKYYGLTVEDYARLFNAQNGCCSICQKKLDLNSSTTVIDHCHHTSRARDILCMACNTKLPASVEEAKRYLTYLQKHLQKHGAALL